MQGLPRQRSLFDVRRHWRGLGPLVALELKEQVVTGDCALSGGVRPMVFTAKRPRGDGLLDVKQTTR